MKLRLFGFVFLFASSCFAQADFPALLQGTWKMEGREIYEHWDQMNEHSMKGLSYALQDGKVTIMEYLEIFSEEKEVFYFATVPGQNQGESIRFAMKRADSVFLFENPQHDFPQSVMYQILDSNMLFVRVSGGAQEGFSYRMIRQKENAGESDSNVHNPNYDPALASELGGDDYGMKAYILVMLKTGKNTTTDKALISSSFRGHLDNINRLVEEGKMTVAGPLMKNEKNYRGIFILNVNTAEEAKVLLDTDPAIRAGLLDFELYQWYGSAALPVYLEASDKIWRVKP